MFCNGRHDHAHFLLVALFGPWIAPYGATEIIPSDARQPPSAVHWFGTDNLGGCFQPGDPGAREILVYSGLGTLLAVLGGTFLVCWAGYRGGWLDEGLMRLFDSLLALPALLLALLFWARWAVQWGRAGRDRDRFTPRSLPGSCVV